MEGYPGRTGVTLHWLIPGGCGRRCPWPGRGNPLGHKRFFLILTQAKRILSSLAGIGEVLSAISTNLGRMSGRAKRLVPVCELRQGALRRLGAQHMRGAPPCALDGAEKRVAPRNSGCAPAARPLPPTPLSCAHPAARDDGELHPLLVASRVGLADGDERWPARAPPARAGHRCTRRGERRRGARPPGNGRARSLLTCSNWWRMRQAAGSERPRCRWSRLAERLFLSGVGQERPRDHPVRGRLVALKMGPAVIEGWRWRRGDWELAGSQGAGPQGGPAKPSAIQGVEALVYGAVAGEELGEAEASLALHWVARHENLPICQEVTGQHPTLQSGLVSSGIGIFFSRTVEVEPHGWALPPLRDDRCARPCFRALCLAATDVFWV